MEKVKYYNAILELTQEKTITSISVRDIAKHLNITTGSLYYHFNGKEDLLNQMFSYYKHKIIDYTQSIDDDPTTFLNNYITYNFEHNLQYAFVYSSELSNFLDQQSLDLSLQAHLLNLDKLKLDYELDAHIITIVFGTIRAYLLAPSYMRKCEQSALVDQLVRLITDYQKKNTN